MKEARFYLVAYDIASPKRWRHVVKLVRRVGERRQLSVFICRMTPRRRKLLEKQIRCILSADEDRLMIADLSCDKKEAWADNSLVPLIL
jgi:CRISPR-associated protein Cas2